MPTITRESQSASEQIGREIQAEVMRRLKEAGSEEELAKHLGMLPAGVAVLRRRTNWSLEEALKVADRLGLRVRVEVVRGEQRG